MIENWIARKRPARFERRIDFENYDLTSAFLDLTADLSEQEGFYPDMNFGRTHVSMTIYMKDDRAELAQEQRRFAEQVNVFAPTNKIAHPLSSDYMTERD